MMITNIKSRPRISLQKLRGFSLVSAIFLLLILAGLGAAMVNIATVQHTSAALDLEGSRAYQAARAGIELGLFQGVPTPGVCPAAINFAPPAPTLSRFTVTVTCVVGAAVNTASGSITARQLTATACNQPTDGACPNNAPSANYVQRVLQVTF